MPELPGNRIASALHDADGIAHFRVGFAQPAARRRPAVLTPTCGLVWVLAGAGELRLGRRQLPLQPGDAFLRIPQRRHGQFLDQAGPAAIAFCAMPAGSLSPLERAGLISTDEPVRHPGIHDDLIRRWLQLYERCRDGGPGPLLCSEGLQLGYELLQRARRPLSDDASFLAAAQSLLRSNACNRRALDELIGDRCYITWRQRFTRLAGESPGRFRIRCRLQEAGSLLRGTELPIKHIARSCGYDDVHNFARQFKQHHGCTPARYRAEEDTKDTKDTKRTKY